VQRDLSGDDLGLWCSKLPKLPLNPVDHVQLNDVEAY